MRSICFFQEVVDKERGKNNFRICLWGLVGSWVGGLVGWWVGWLVG
ncbi:MAG: hypothetical protein ACPGWR_04030 [Ardenticatenaceae bacterium]